MRTIVIKEKTSATALKDKLLSASAKDAAFDRVQALNPHLDLTRLTPGTVLIVPDTPDFKPSASAPVGDDNFEAFTAEVENGLASASARMKQGIEALSADRTAVAAVLKTAAVKRSIDSDQLLKKQIDTVNARFADDTKNTQNVQKQWDAIQEQVKAELDALGRLIQ